MSNENFDDSVCNGCSQHFGYLAVSKNGDESYCFNCYTERFGTTDAFNISKKIPSIQLQRWEKPIDNSKILFYKMIDRYGVERLDMLVGGMVTLSVEATVNGMGREICKRGDCCEPNASRMMRFENENIKDTLVYHAEGILKIKSKANEDTIGKDPELAEYVHNEIVDQINKMGSSGCDFIKYLVILYIHLKHTVNREDCIGNFVQTGIFDLKNKKIRECDYAKSFDEVISYKLIQKAKEILDDSQYYKVDSTEINSFSVSYTVEEAVEKITRMLFNYHQRESHSNLRVITKDEIEYLKSTNLSYNWDIIEQSNAETVICNDCGSLYPKIKQEQVSREDFNKQLKETIEKVKEISLGSDPEHEEQINKMRKEKPKILNVTDATNKLVKMGIKSQNQLKRAKQRGYCKDIPKNPVEHYNGLFKWVDVQNAKGRKNVITIDKVEQAIKMLKNNWSLYMRKPEGFFYDWFDSWGLFDANDPYKQRFFTEFINLKQSVEGRKELFEAISSGRFDMVKGHFPKERPNRSPIPRIPYSNDLTNVTERKRIDELFDDEREAGVHQILKETDSLIPMDKDSRAFKLHVRITVQEIWLSVLKNGVSEKNKVENWSRNATALLTRVVITKFLEEYKAVHDLWSSVIASEYRGKPPNEMQLYVAYKIKKMNGYCNFSSTGVGKTKSAIIGSRVTKSKRTLVVCPSNILKQWDSMIHADYPLSYTSISEKSSDPVFPDTKFKGDFRYHIVNYEKFGITKTVDRLIEEITKTKVDMVIIDEAQWVKQRDIKLLSNRRKNIKILLDQIRKRNPSLKVLFLTATPIINNLTEGIMLLEMVANKSFPHLKTTNKIRNASRLYMEFLEYSLRFKKIYPLKENHHEICVSTKIPIRISADEIRSYNYSDWEILCTPERIPEMIKLVKKHGRAIIYTEYVEKVIEPIRIAFENEGFKVGLYTGKDKTGLKKPTDVKGEFTNPFLNGDLDVLIASSPIAEGIDGLQKVCNTMIFNGLTWTYAKFEQIIGRLIRTGQVFDNVNIYTILSTIENYEYDRKIKLDRLFQKEMLQMCVLDGKIPDIERWNEKTGNINKSFIETVLKNRETRVASKKDIRSTGVSETN